MNAHFQEHLLSLTRKEKFKSEIQLVNSEVKNLEEKDDLEKKSAVHPPSP